MREPLNSIFEKENSQAWQDYLAAGAYFFDKVKRLAGLQFFLSVVIPVLFSVLAVSVPEVKVWASIYGIFISVVDTTVFEVLQRNWKRDGAKLYECFDCGVLELPWPQLLAGLRPPPEKVISTAARFKRAADGEKRARQLRRIHSWYPEVVGGLPIGLARLLCQRSNIWWPAELRPAYVAWVKAAVALLLVTAFILAIVLRMSVEEFVLSILTPLFPAILWFIREVRRQRDSIEKLDSLLKYVEGLWEKALAGELPAARLDAEARLLQDELFRHRCTNQPLFNWVHNLIRDKYQTLLEAGAEEYVRNAGAALGLGPRPGAEAQAPAPADRALSPAAN